MAGASPCVPPTLDQTLGPTRSGEQPRLVAQQPAPLCLSHGITHSDTRCASSEQRGFHLLQVGRLAREVRPGGLGRLTLGP